MTPRNLLSPEELKSLSSAEKAEYAALAERLQACAQDIHPSAVFRARSRERLLARMHTYSGKGWGHFLSSFWSVRRTLVAVVSTVLVFTGTFYFLHSPSFTSAHEFATLQVDGEVWLQRNNMLIVAGDDYKLTPGDLIRTTDSSKAEIYFSDLNISRLDSNTTVRLLGSSLEDASSSPLPVQIELQTGRLWARTLPSASSSGIEVITPHGVVSADYAAFNVEVSDTNTSVTVKENSAQVALKETTQTSSSVSPQTNIVAQTTVIKDQKIILQSSSTDLSDQIKLNSLANLSSEENDWLTSNTSADEVYLAQVKEEVKANLKEETGALPGDPMYTFKQIGENARVTLAFNDVDKTKAEVAVAQTRLNEALVLLDSGATDSAASALTDFETKITDISTRLEENAELKSEVKPVLDDVLHSSEQNLATALPDSSEYVVKEKLADLKVAIASDESEALQAKLQNASTKLQEVNDLLSKSSYDLALLSLQTYLSTLQEAQTLARSLASSSSTSALLDAVSRQNTQLDVIATLQDSIPANTPVYFAVLNTRASARTLLLSLTDTISALPAPAVDTPILETVPTEGALLNGVDNSIAPASAE